MFLLINLWQQARILIFCLVYYKNKEKSPAVFNSAVFIESSNKAAFAF